MECEMRLLTAHAIFHKSYKIAERLKTFQRQCTLFGAVHSLQSMLRTLELRRIYSNGLCIIVFKSRKQLNARNENRNGNNHHVCEYLPMFCIFSFIRNAQRMSCHHLSHPEPHGFNACVGLSQGAATGFSLHNLLDHNGTSSPFFGA